MPNKISGIDGAPSRAQVGSVGAGRPVQRSQDAASDGASLNTSKDDAQSVQITGAARRLADLDQKVRSLPDVNEERVSQLRAAIEQGSYQVRPQHIADKLISLERTLGSVSSAEQTRTSEK